MCFYLANFYGEHVSFLGVNMPQQYMKPPQLISDLATFSSPYLLLGSDLNIGIAPPPRKVHCKVQSKQQLINMIYLVLKTWYLVDQTNLFIF